MEFSVIVIAIILTIAVVGGVTNIYPPCATVAFTTAGQLDTGSILYNCSAVIPGNTEPPSTFPNSTGGYSPTMVSVQLSLNNLISVDDIASRLTIDFFYRLKWVDPRWNLPTEMWDYINPHVLNSDGLSIYGYVYAQNELEVWKPDITFQQIVEMDVVSESFKLFPGGVFYWSRHVVASFVEPSMIYKSYPQDQQNFSLVIQSYAYSSFLIDINFINNEPITYVNNFQSTQSDTNTNLQQNQIWSYQGFTAYLQDVLQPNFANPQRTFSMAFINLNFRRQSAGIVVRFILPLTLLLLLTGLTFWITFENRVDTTITILVSASALYIVILQNVPNVGYLTDADKFIFWMFLLLVAVVSMHQVYATLQDKVDRWPLRIIALRVIETLGRVMVPCIIIFYFQSTISYFEDSRPITTAFTIVIATILFMREVFGIRNAYDLAIQGLFAKVNREDCTVAEVSKIESFVLNRLLFRKYSFELERLAKELATKSIGFQSEKDRGVYLRNLHQMDELMGATKTGSTTNRESIAAASRNLNKNERSSLLHPGVELTDISGSNNPMLHRSVHRMGSISGNQPDDPLSGNRVSVHGLHSNQFNRTTATAALSNLAREQSGHTVADLEIADNGRESSFNQRITDVVDSDDEH